MGFGRETCRPQSTVRYDCPSSVRSISNMTYIMYGGWSHYVHGLYTDLDSCCRRQGNSLP